MTCQIWPLHLIAPLELRKLLRIGHDRPRNIQSHSRSCRTITITAIHGHRGWAVSVGVRALHVGLWGSMVGGQGIGAAKVEGATWGAGGVGAVENIRDFGGGLRAVGAVHAGCDAKGPVAKDVVL